MIFDITYFLGTFLMFLDVIDHGLKLNLAKRLRTGMIYIGKFHFHHFYIGFILACIGLVMSFNFNKLFNVVFLIISFVIISYMERKVRK